MLRGAGCSCRFRDSRNERCLKPSGEEAPISTLSRLALMEGQLLFIGNVFLRTLRDLGWRRIALAATLSMSPEIASGAYITMVEHGPSSNRVNVMFLGDGYTASELGTTYVNDISSMWAHMFGNTEDPFPRYRNFFNA